MHQRDLSMLDLRRLDRFYDDMMLIDAFYATHRAHNGEIGVRVERNDEIDRAIGSIYGQHMLAVEPEMRVQCECGAHVLVPVEAFREWHRWVMQQNLLPLNVERRPDPEPLRKVTRRITLEN